MNWRSIGFGDEPGADDVSLLSPRGTVISNAGSGAKVLVSRLGPTGRCAITRITKRFVEGLRSDPERELYIADDDLPGFGIRLRSSGAASYVIRYRNETGESRRFTIGRVSVLSPGDARKMAQRQLAAVAAGADPVNERRKKRRTSNATTQGAEDMEQIERLKQFKIFAELDENALGAVARIAQVRESAAGEQIMEEGAPADHLFLLARGRAAVKVREVGGAQVQIDDHGPGDVLGWGSVVEPHVYTASAWLTEPAELILVDGAALRELCDADKEMGYTVFKNIGEIMSARLGQAVRGQGIDEMHRFKVLRDLDFSELDAIGRISEVREFVKGDRLTVEGAPAEEMYLFLSGSAEVRVRDPQGRQVLVDQIGPGDVLGWSAVMKPYLYTASAWAAEPSEAIVVDGHLLRELCASNRRLGYHITKGVGEVIFRRFGRAVGARDDLRAKDMRAFDGPERVIWDNGEIQLTTEAVLIGMKSDSPDVIPLDALQGVDVVDGQVVFRMARGDVWSPELREPEHLAALTRDEMDRARYAQRRKDYYLS